MSLIRGDALTIPLADDSVDLIVTSPPYFALRSYTDDGEHYSGQLGSEPTPAAFIDALVAVTRECVRVLKPSGSLFVNLGDKYVGGGQGGNVGGNLQGPNDRVNGEAARKTYGLQTKSLMGLPWRYAIRCIDQLGLILRAEIIWSKPNGLPESVQDRVRRSHEQWFHFTLEPRYYSAVDEIREAHAEKTLTHRGGGQSWGYEDCPDNNWGDAKVRRPDPLGKLPGSVWTVPTEPLRVPDDLPQHFAAFPSEWPRRIILGWSPSGICVECGEGRRPAVERVTRERRNGEASRHGLQGPAGSGAGGGLGDDGSVTITGESCACPTPNAPTRPAVVLDPFCGTGTSVLVANALGRTGIGLDLSADYLKLARWRVNDPRMRAKVLQVEPPAKQIEGQGVLAL